jgi:hypothetical protein
MAYEVPGQIIGNLNATANLSALQYSFVGITVSGGVAGSTVFTARPLGILQNAPTSNQTCEIMVSGISKLGASTTTIAVGDLVGSTAAGRAVTYTSGTTGFVAAQVLETVGSSLGLLTVALFPAQRVI